MPSDNAIEKRLSALEAAIEKLSGEDDHGKQELRAEIEAIRKRFDEQGSAAIGAGEESFLDALDSLVG
jgi:hypothetical protein